MRAGLPHLSHWRRLRLTLGRLPTSFRELDSVEAFCGALDGGARIAVK
jgi:hypothetical protein